MNPGRPESYVISSNERDLDRIAVEFPDYLKLLSICWLLRIGVGTTEGIVLTSSSPEAVDAAAEYARLRGWTKFMIRHDKPLGRPRTAQGGFLIALEEIHSWIQPFVTDGICLLLEPLDPLLNGYNVSCLLEPDSAIIEVAGPGFDASDLQRGEVQPHERGTLDTESTRIIRTGTCSQEAYLASVVERERKIWWKHSQRELSQKRWRRLTRQESEACHQFIVSRRGASLPQTYVPMGKRQQSQYLNCILPAILHWRAHRRSYPAVFAGSFVQDGTFRIWDVNISARWLG